MSSNTSSEKVREIANAFLRGDTMAAIHLAGSADAETAGKSLRYQLRSSEDNGSTWTILFDHTINIPEGGGGGGVTPVTPPSPPPGGGGGGPTLPPDGRPQPEKGANTDPNTWQTVAMTSDPTKYKVVDDKGINVADQFNSQATAQQYIDYYKANPNPLPVTPPEGGGGGGGGTGGTTTPAGLRIYKPKAGGFQNLKAVESGGQGASDGIRYNVSNTARIVNREYTTYGTISKLASGDKMHLSPKIGSHGSTGEGSALLECSIDYTGGKARFRTEGPHPQYHGCSGGTVESVPKIPIGREIAFKAIQWLTGSGDDSHIDFYYDFAPDSKAGKFNWVKYGSFDYPSSKPPCEIALVKSGQIVGPAKAQDTMRMNSAFTPSPWYGEIVEIELTNGKPTPANTAAARMARAKPKHNSEPFETEEECSIEE